MSSILDAITGIIVESWIILNDSAIYVLLGFFIAGIIKAFIPDELVSSQLGKPGLASVFKAALFGIPIPLCSCGVIPAAMGIRKQGASRGATTAFLISTPETGVDSIAITYGLLGPVMTIFRPIAAFVTAMVAGLLENIFNQDKVEAENTDALLENDSSCVCPAGCAAAVPETIEKASLKNRISESFNFAFGDLLADIGKWLLVGIILAGIVSYLVPENFFNEKLGTGFIPMLLMLVVGIPIYVCATSSTPLAAALILKGLSPGAALVFLIAGPATNAATIMVVYKLLGKRSLIIYLVSIAVCALGFGYILDLTFSGMGINFVEQIEYGGSIGEGWFRILTSILLLLLIGRSVFLEWREKIK